jgi:hypothetical protein
MQPPTPLYPPQRALNTRAPSATHPLTPHYPPHLAINTLAPTPRPGKTRKLSDTISQIPHNISELLSKKGINNFRLRSFILPCGFNDDILFTSLAAANPSAFQIPQTQ